MIEVSVIMPVFNLEEYVCESIESVIKQQFRNWELIIIDDGSTDRTIEKVIGFCKNDSRLKLLRQSNQGVSVARNKGIEVSKGKYIAFLDGDDLWEESFLSIMLNEIKKTGNELVLSSYKYLSKKNEIKRIDSFFDKNESLLYQCVKGNFKIHIGAILVSNDSLKKHSIKFTEECYMKEDTEFLYKAISILSATAICKPMLIYRQRKGSSTQGKWDSLKVFSGIKSLERIEKIFMELGENPTNIDIISTAHFWIIYAKADFLWKLLKNGKVDEVKTYLLNGWTADVKEISERNDIKKSKKWKFKIVLTQNRFLWGIVLLFSRMRKNFQTKSIG